MCFLDLIVSSNSFIHGENYLALLIQCYFTPEILESGNAQLSLEFFLLIIFLVISFFLAGNAFEHSCLNASLNVLRWGQPSSLVKR